MRKFTYFYSLLLTALFLLPWSGIKADPSTLGPLYDGTNTYGEYVPLEGNYADYYQRVQVVYPKGDLTAMAGKNITKMSFYLRTKATKAWGATIEVALAEVDDANFDASTSFLSASFATVYSGTSLNGMGDLMEINFETPFTYSGDKNLLFELRVTGKGSYSKTVFAAKGGYDNYFCIYKNNSSSYASMTTGTRRSARPKTLFTYEDAAPSSCEKPGIPVASDITATSATLTWDASEGVTNYQFVRVAKGATPDWTGVTPQAVTTVTYDDLTKFTDYDFYVRSYCDAGEGNQSAAEKVSFKTLKSCYEPTNLVVVEAEITSSSAKITWAASGHGETQWQYTYEVFDDEIPDWTNAVVTDQTEATLSILNPATPYQVWVRSYCDAGDQSEAITEYFATECGSVTGDGWSQNFDEETAYPDCWKSLGATPSLSTSSWYVHSGKGLYYYGGTGNMIVILPEFTEIANQTKTLQLTLWYSNYSSTYTGDSYASPQVGWITNPNDATTFHAVETLAKVDSWTQAKVALSGAPSGSLVAIRYGGASSSGYLLLDDFSVSEAPSCLAPSTAAGAATAHNQASISWTANGTELAWQIRYSNDNGANWLDTLDAAVNPFNLTGLEGSSDYIVQVRANCGDGEENKSDWSASSASFHTPCAPQGASDYSENFETTTAGSGKLPDCWVAKQTRTYSNVVYPCVQSSGGKTNPKALYFYGGSASTVNTVVLPPLDAQINTLTIEFYYNASVSSSWTTYGNPVLGYIAADGTTFVEIETIAQSSSYIKYKKDLSLAALNIPDNASRLAISYDKGSYGYGSFYVDDIKIYPTPTCVEPTDVEAPEEEITANSAKIQWTEPQGKSTWRLQYSTDKTNWLDANGGEDITSNPYTLNGLSAQTTYYARVRTICAVGDTSAWSAPSEAFLTACAAEALPFSEDFSGAITCWKMETCHSSTGVDGGKFKFYYKSTPPSQYLITPELETSANQVKVEFDYWRYSNSYPETFKVGYSTTTKDTASFNWGDEITCTNSNSASPDSYSEKFPAGVKYVAIQCTSNNQYYLYIDNFSVSEYVAPACDAPTAFAVSEIGTNSAKLTWDSEATEFALQDSVPDGTWTDVTGTIASPFVLNGLTENTAYTVRVKANCGAGNESEWVELAEPFRTNCVTKELDWKEEVTADKPLCWDIEETVWGSGKNQWSVSNSQSVSLSYSLRYYMKDNGGQHAEITTPTVKLSKKAVLQFAYRNRYSTGTSTPGAVNFSYTVFNATTGDTLFCDTVTAATAEDAWADKRVRLYEFTNIDDEVYVTFRAFGAATNNKDAYLYLDDIEIKEKPCDLPTILAVDSASTAAAVTWKRGDEEDEWSLQYSVKDANSWTEVSGLTDTTCVISGLVNETVYEVQVKAVCGVGKESAWSASTFFTTDCAAPAAPQIGARTTTTAAISWQSLENEWNVLYREKGETDWNHAVDNHDAKSFTIESLTPGATYQIRVQAICGDTSAVSELTTKCASIDALPFNEDFESVAINQLPACWDRISAGEYPAVVSGGAAHGGDGKCACFFGEDSMVLVLPAFASLENRTLSYYYKVANGGSLEFGYLDNNGDFQPLEDLTADAYSATPCLFALNDTYNDKYLAFRFAGTAANSAAYLDDVRVSRYEVFEDVVTEANSTRLEALEGQKIDFVMTRPMQFNGSYNTLCLPFDLSAEDLADVDNPFYNCTVKTFDYAHVADNELQLAITGANGIQAGVPCLVKYNGAAGEDRTFFLFKDVTIAVHEADSVKDEDAGVAYKGIINKFEMNAELDNGPHHFIFVGGNNQLYWPGADRTMKGFRAYFHVTPENLQTTPIKKGMPARIVERENGTTAIDNLGTDNTAVKLLEKDQVVIIRNGVKYSIQGQKIQ